MRALRILNTTGAGDARSDQLDNWDEGQPAEAIDLEGDLPVTLAAPGSPTVADLRNVLDYFLGQFGLTYKLGVEYKPLDGVTGSTLRNVHRVMTQREVTNDFVGVAKLAVAQIFRVRLRITPNRQNARGLRRLIGWTQGKTIEVSIQEGAALVPGALGITRTAGVNATWRVCPVYRVGPDKFSHLPFYREVNRAALDVQGPEGKMLAVFDDNAAFAATVIGKHRVRIGTVELVKLMEPRYVNEEYLSVIDAGGSSITDEVTLFYAADPYADERELPTGAAYVSLVNQDVASILARFVYLPAVTPSEAEAIAIAAAIDSESDVNAQLSEPPSDPKLNGHQATAAIEFVRRDDARFSTAAGLMAGKAGRAAVPFVPASAVAMASALKGADAAGSQALARRAQKLALLRMPGVTTTSGKGAGPIRNAARSAFSSLF